MAGMVDRALNILLVVLIWLAWLTGHSISSYLLLILI